MASFTAELRVAGHVFPVRRGSYHLHQATDARGRAATKVRYEPVQLTLDVPDSDFLLAWAAAPHKRLPADVVFRDAAGGSALETLQLKAAYCVGYREAFASGDTDGGAYVCHLVLSDPSGWTLQAGGPLGAFVVPAARNHGVPGAGGGGAASGVSQHAADWAAATAQALGPARIATLYAAYVAVRQQKNKPVRSQAAWWGIDGQRGGARHTVGGCLGEYQADKLFAAQGHAKLNHGGQLVGLLDPPRGKGLDGVWRNATPPPEYFITETKFTTAPGELPKLAKGQMSDKWTFNSNKIESSLTEEDARNVRIAATTGNVEKRLLHIDSTGNMTQYRIDSAGQTTKI